VLVAVDLNEHGGRAVPYAYGVVNNGGIVRLVHVVTPHEVTTAPHTGSPHAAPLPGKSRARELEETKKRLGALAPEDAAARGIVTEVTVLEAEDVADAIRKRPINLALMWCALAPTIAPASRKPFLALLRKRC
jgi:hypothetical protein